MKNSHGLLYMLVHLCTRPDPNPKWSHRPQNLLAESCRVFIHKKASVIPRDIYVCGRKRGRTDISIRKYICVFDPNPRRSQNFFLKKVPRFLALYTRPDPNPKWSYRPQNLLSESDRALFIIQTSVIRSHRKCVCKFWYQSQVIIMTSKHPNKTKDIRIFWSRKWKFFSGSRKSGTWRDGRDPAGLQ